MSLKKDSRRECTKVGREDDVEGGESDPGDMNVPGGW